MADDFERLILSLMNSLAAASPWKAFLNDLESYLGCQRCSLILRHAGERGFGVIVSDSLGDIYFADLFDFGRDSPFRDLPKNRIFVQSEMMSLDALQQKHPRHFEYQRRQQVLDIIAFDIDDVATGMTFHFRFRRSEGSQLFAAEEVAAVTRLLPFLQPAVAIYAHMLHAASESYISEKTYSQLEVASITLKDNGEVLSMNAYAQALMKMTGDFFVDDGLLRFASRKQHAAFRQRFEQLTHDAAATTCSLQLPAGELRREALYLSMTRHEVPYEFRSDMHCVIALTFRSADRQFDVSASTLRQLFNLTPAEAQLAKCLVEGDSLAEAAGHLGRLERTARNQLSSIFAKTGVHKQHQLISHIMQAVSKHRL